MIKNTMTTVPQAAIQADIAERLNVCQEFPAILRVPMPGVDVLGWLDSQSFETKFAWGDRSSNNMVAGVGTAADVVVGPGESPETAIERCRELMGDCEQMRFYGGLSFDGQAAWQGFGAGRFVAPRFLLKDGVLSITVMNREDVIAANLDLQRLRWESSESNWPAVLPAPSELRFAPTKDAWQSMVDEALTLIRSEVLEKIVLARKTTLQFAESINPLQVASCLAEKTYDCYVFCFQYEEGQAFVGATPERLFHRNGSTLLSEVVAGTRPRGGSSGEDQRLAYDLLSSDKDQLEHDIVRKSIRQKLHKFVEHLSVDSHASVLRLAHKQHLCSAVQGELRADIEEGSLLERLHPTPAVGGYPTDNALPEIARLEPFNRGWYAAPIGWIGKSDAEFVVGIRSGIVEQDRVSLYSGAGIVKGSDPNQEWDEVENKIQDFVSIFAGNSPND